MKYLNLGGDFNDNIDQVKETVNEMNLKLILDQGHSVVGNAGVFVCKVLGVKSKQNKSLIVVDGAPSPQSTGHHIELAKPPGEAIE